MSAPWRSTWCLGFHSCFHVRLKTRMKVLPCRRRRPIGLDVKSVTIDTKGRYVKLMGDWGNANAAQTEMSGYRDRGALLGRRVGVAFHRHRSRPARGDAAASR